MCEYNLIIARYPGEILYHYTEAELYKFLNFFNFMPHANFKKIKENFCVYFHFAQKATTKKIKFPYLLFGSKILI